MRRGECQGSSDEWRGHRRSHEIIVLTLCTMLFASVLPGQAQQANKSPRIGMLISGSPSTHRSRIDAFRQGLRELGYVEGRNIAIEYRYADGKFERLPELAAELVRVKVDIIVTSGSIVTPVAKKATSTIPIVMAQDNDPVATGGVASLARPGGNITGLSQMSPELNGKRLELLKEIVPKLSRVAIFGNATEPGNAPALKETEEVARTLGIKFQYVEIQKPDDFESAFEAATRGQAQAVIWLASPITFIHRKRIMELAAKSRLPAVYTTGEYPDVGGFMSYGPSYVDLFRRAATYVDKILKGAKPGDLPVEQPTKFELVINLKTAKQLGVTIPQSVLYRADRVISN
jgi:ABC-type uncharacterized transport system substrate-binding protein